MKKMFLSLSLLYVCPMMCMEQTKIQPIESNQAPAAIGPYSQAILVSNAKAMLFVSGQLPINPKTGELENDPVRGFQQCMENISAILKEADMSLKDVVDVTILLKDISNFPSINKSYETFFEKPYPARATFQAGALPKDAVVEVKVTAAK